jgi:hypothetical protein
MRGACCALLFVGLAAAPAALARDQSDVVFTADKGRESCRVLYTQRDGRRLVIFEAERGSDLCEEKAAAYQAMLTPADEQRPIIETK